MQNKKLTDLGNGKWEIWIRNIGIMYYHNGYLHIAKTNETISIFLPDNRKKMHSRLHYLLAIGFFDQYKNLNVKEE